jgi:hypothetical protein
MMWMLRKKTMERKDMHPLYQSTLRLARQKKRKAACDNHEFPSLCDGMINECARNTGKPE